MIARESQLLGIHLNDGYGRRDDGLMVGTVNFMQTLEVLFQLIRKGFDGVIYFDTFPDVTGLDPVRRMREQYRHGQLPLETGQGANRRNRTYWKPSIVKTRWLVRISSGATIFGHTGRQRPPASS